MNRRGLTLIEILVVMGIIMTLAGLLLPVISAAKGRAKSAACISNVRQLLVATTLYTSDSDTFLPHYINDNWFLCNADPSCISWPPMDSPFPGLLQQVLRPYGATPEVYKCPYAKLGNYLVNEGYGDYVYRFPIPHSLRPQWPQVMSIDDEYIQNSALWQDDRLSFDEPQHPDRKLTAGYADGHVVNKYDRQFTTSWWPD